jgi:hypothetical protein
MNTKDDRRKHKRYSIQQGAFAALPSNYLIGQIKNLSQGGVSFTCFASGRQSYSMPVLEIFSKDDGFYLREIPFKVVSEIDVEEHVPCSSLQMKQISGEFADLTDYQESQLDYFLQKFTKAERDIIKNIAITIDKGGRRYGGDRRAFSYAIHIPERRSGTDRRGEVDRRATRYKKESATEFRRRIE